MKAIKILVSTETTEAIRQMGDRKLRGRVWVERHNGKEYLRFEPYRQKNKECAHIVISIIVVDGSELNVEPLKSKENVTL